jgi:hypothetical protein
MRHGQPLSMLTATSTAAGGPDFLHQVEGNVPTMAPLVGRFPMLDELTRLIEREVASLAVLLGVGEDDPLDAPLCTIELACARIRGLWPPA